MDSASLIVIIVQSVGLIFAAGVQFASVREHDRRITAVEKKLDTTVADVAFLKGKETA